MLYWAKFYNEINNHPVPFDPHPVKGVCTGQAEYLGILSPDNQIMFYTRKQPHVRRLNDPPGGIEKEDEVFSFSRRDPVTGEFDGGKPMPPPFNKNNNEGGATVSIDNKHLFFTVCRNEGGPQMNCDVWFSDNINGEWTKPVKVPGINDSVYWDSQPTLAADGKTLYFCSDRKGGYGGVDIYKTVKDPKTGIWSTPENAGKPINTRYDEFAPFLHSDFQSLYFSSSGHPSVGGQDIFFTHIEEDGKWSEPKNLGIPINTTGDDMGFFVSTDGHYGYFASDQPSRAKGKSVGKFDIYQFELYKEVRPDEIVFIKGKVEDNSIKGSKNFTVEIKDAVTKKSTDALVDTLSGEYMAMVNVKQKNDLIVTVKKDDAAFSSQMITKEDVAKASTKRDANLPGENKTPAKNEPVVQAKKEQPKTTVLGDDDEMPAPKYYSGGGASDVEPTSKDALKTIKTNMRIDTLKVGQAYTINNIYYNTNSAELDPRSTIVVEEFVEYLKANPKIKIEIHGHTDNVGNDKDNLALSTDRAFTVRDMIIKQGIDEKRIVTFKGFGATKPVADNTTEDGRSKNRRTEFMIVAK